MTSQDLFDSYPKLKKEWDLFISEISDLNRGVYILIYNRKNVQKLISEKLIHVVDADIENLKTRSFEQPANEIVNELKESKSSSFCVHLDSIGESLNSINRFLFWYSQNNVDFYKKLIFLVDFPTYTRLSRIGGWTISTYTFNIFREIQSLVRWRNRYKDKVKIEELADRTFRKLDRDLLSNIVVIGIPQDIFEENNNSDEEKKHKIPAEENQDLLIKDIILLPEDTRYSRERFVRIKKLVSAFGEIASENHQINGGSLNFDELPVEKKYIKAIHHSIQHIIGQDDESLGLVSYCSTPILFENYYINVVVQLNKKTHDAYHSLSNFHTLNNVSSMPISLIHAVSIEFLHQSRTIIENSSSEDEYRVFDRDPGEIIRYAGKQLISNIVYKVAERQSTVLFDALNNISSLKYEGEDSIGKVIIAAKKHPNVEVVLTFAKPIKVTEHKSIRKLLEISSSELSLLCDSIDFYGLGKLKGLYDHKKENLFFIRFAKHHSWEVMNGRHFALMRVEYNQPSLSKLPFDEEVFRNVVISGFGEDVDIDKLLEIVYEATNQKQGTIIVVSTEVDREADRLSNESTEISPIKLTPEITSVVTSIDGAVLIDPYATCYAIGVILDGTSSKTKGDRARGARFNSSVRYVNSKKKSCIAIIISEDGYYDLVHNFALPTTGEET